MADDPIRGYVEARAVYENARSRAEHSVAAVQDVAKKLSRWDSVMFANVSSAGFPLELQTALSIDGRQWPSIDALAQGVSSYHTARSNMEQAWSRVPGHLRSGLQAPPR